MFDKDVSKVLGLSASDIRDRQLKSGDLENFPTQLHRLNNKQLAFKVVISPYNLDNKYYVYTVSKLCDDVEVIEELQGLEQGEEVTPNEADDVVMKLGEASHNAPDSKNCASVTGSSLATEVEKDCVSSPAVKRPIPFVIDETNVNDGSAVRSVKKLPA